jgi:hypothetical protein
MKIFFLIYTASILYAQSESLVLYQDNNYLLNWQHYESTILLVGDSESIQEYNTIKAAFFDSKILTSDGIDLLRFNSGIKINLITISRLKVLPELSKVKNEFEYKKIENTLVPIYLKYAQQLKAIPYFIYKTNAMSLREYDFNQKCFYEYADPYLIRNNYTRNFKDYFWGHMDFNSSISKDRTRQMGISLYEINAVKLYLTEDEAQLFINNNPERKVIAFILSVPYKFYSKLDNDYITEKETQQFYATYAIITDIKLNVIGTYKYKN